jgi:hypothetical protein
MINYLKVVNNGIKSLMQCVIFYKTNDKILFYSKVLKNTYKYSSLMFLKLNDILKREKIFKLSMQHLLLQTINFQQKIIQFRNNKTYNFCLKD